VATVRDTVDACRIKLKGLSEPVDPAKYRILDEVLAYTNRLAAEIDPFGAVPAPAPVEPELPAPAPAPAPIGASATTPVQPDLFGGAELTQAPRRARSGRR
jgi:exodeoxyribonuclease-1